MQATDSSDLSEVRLNKKRFGRRQKCIEFAKLFASLTLLTWHTMMATVELQMIKGIKPTQFHQNVFDASKKSMLFEKVLAHFSYEKYAGSKIVFRKAPLSTLLMQTDFLIAAIPSAFFAAVLVAQTSSPPKLISPNDGKKQSSTTTTPTSALSSPVRSPWKLITHLKWKFIIIASSWSWCLFVHLNRRIKLICHILLTMYAADSTINEWRVAALIGLVGIWVDFNSIRILRKIIKNLKHFWCVTRLTAAQIFNFSFFRLWYLCSSVRCCFFGKCTLCKPF